ncbi:hypothetical protein M405DRAFT_87997 [Rhizopogon salebrosus TDB-379]|nr:hypothetical protein M405DRAFT_87997 [Rhizopogon salebrosus TDB-379]
MPVLVNEDAAGTSASSGGGRHHPTTTDVESRMHAVAAWLSNKAKEEPGYTAFKAGQHHVQPNASVIVSWQFAVRFCEKYSQRHCSAGEASSRHKSHATGTCIKKKDVQDSLGVGSTWMAEAQQAVQILRIYGEGGSTPRPDVIKKCSSLDEKAGARDLLAYLRSQR